MYMYMYLNKVRKERERGRKEGRVFITEECLHEERITCNKKNARRIIHQKVTVNIINYTTTTLVMILIIPGNEGMRKRERERELG